MALYIEKRVNAGYFPVLAVTRKPDLGEAQSSTNGYISYNPFFLPPALSLHRPNTTPVKTSFCDLDITQGVVDTDKISEDNVTQLPQAFVHNDHLFLKGDRNIFRKKGVVAEFSPDVDMPVSAVNIGSTFIANGQHAFENNGQEATLRGSTRVKNIFQRGNTGFWRSCKLTPGEVALSARQGNGFVRSNTQVRLNVKELPRSHTPEAHDPDKMCAEQVLSSLKESHNRRASRRTFSSKSGGSVRSARRKAMPVKPVEIFISETASLASWCGSPSPSGPRSEASVMTPRDDLSTPRSSARDSVSVTSVPREEARSRPVINVGSRDGSRSKLALAHLAIKYIQPARRPQISQQSNFRQPQQQTSIKTYRRQSCAASPAPSASSFRSSKTSDTNFSRESTQTKFTSVETSTKPSTVKPLRRSAVRNSQMLLWGKGSPIHSSRSGKSDSDDEQVEDVVAFLTKTPENRVIVKKETLTSYENRSKGTGTEDLKQYVDQENCTAVATEVKPPSQYKLKVCIPFPEKLI